MSSELGPNDLDRLERLISLRERGALSDEEFENQKRVLLDTNGQWQATKSKQNPQPLGGGRRNSRLTIETPKPLLSVNVWLIGAVILLAVAAASYEQLHFGSFWPKTRTDRSAAPKNAKPIVSSPALEKVEKQVEKTVAPKIDPIAELRASGWDESSTYGGDRCLMDRRGDRENGLNSVFVYGFGERKYYELSFITPLYAFSPDEDAPPASEEVGPLAVKIDRTIIKARHQNHFGNIWEVEIPVTKQSLDKIARAKSISLILSGEEIATESITPNATSEAVIIRCLQQ